MTRKHFKLIAEAINGAMENIDPDNDATAQMNTLQDAAQRMARRFKDENPRFDFYKFMDACGFHQFEDARGR